MTLHLCRLKPSGDAIVGKLAIDGVFECWTLERLGVEIPLGTYHVAFDYSPHFQCDLPHLLDVPGRSHILMHAGNAPEDSRGCILVGKERSSVSVYHSKDALHDLIGVLQSAQTPITITLEAAEA